jgi:3-oxoadipate enol-lactonase
MPKLKANGITINYEQQGNGEPLILVPYLSADNACYAFQVAEYAKYFTCISPDLRGTGQTDGPTGSYSIEVLADDLAAFMHSAGIRKAHISGLSLGAAVGMWLAAKYPDKVQSLSLHGGWTKTDLFIRTVVGSWQLLAQTLRSVPEMVIRSIFPWCLTADLYAAKPEYIESLAGFVRSRPAQSVESFIEQSNAVIGHDFSGQLSKIKVPTQITFGRFDQVTSTRFAEEMLSGIRGSELVIFEGCAHAPIYERVEEFNRKTLEFLQGHSGSSAGDAAAN